MKLGLVSAILEHMNFEEMIDFLSKAGFTCVEVACWPQGNKTRKYGGVCHIDVTKIDEDKAKYYIDYAEQKGITISALAYYPNVLDGDIEKRQFAIDHLNKVIKAASLMGVEYVTSFIGRDQTKDVESNLELVKEVWPEIIKLAEDSNVKISIENCPMLFTRDEWPGGQNLMTRPDIWDKVFEILPSPNLGLNFDPSHFIWQRLDYIQVLRDYKDKLFYVHFKDIKLYPERLKKVGVMAYPLEYMDPKLPGYGDVNWNEFISTLAEIGYDGYTSIEVEDRAFEASNEKIEQSVLVSKRYVDSLFY